MAERELSNGVLYSINTGKLVVRNGIIKAPIVPIKKLEDEQEYSFDTPRRRINLSKFYIEHSNTRILVSEEPGVVYHRCLWLPVRDDKKALYLIISSELVKIQLLKDEIIKRNALVDRLEYFEN